LEIADVARNRDSDSGDSSIRASLRIWNERYEFEEKPCLFATANLRRHQGENFLTVEDNSSLPGFSLSALAQTFCASSRLPVAHNTSPKWAAISASERNSNARFRN